MGRGSVVVSFKADRRLVEAVDRARVRLGMSRSEFIREALYRFLAELGVDDAFDKVEEVSVGDGEVITIVL